MLPGGALSRMLPVIPFQPTAGWPVRGAVRTACPDAPVLESGGRWFDSNTIHQIKQ